MSAAILKWMSGGDTGSSSMAIALVALGGDPGDGKNRYPHDGSDFGRCHRLLEVAPDAKDALTSLAAHSPYWSVLAKAWGDITAANLADLADHGDRAYRLMRCVLEPVEERDPTLIRLSSGISMRFGR